MHFPSANHIWVISLQLWLREEKELFETPPTCDFMGLIWRFIRAEAWLA